MSSAIRRSRAAKLRSQLNLQVALELLVSWYSCGMSYPSRLDVFPSMSPSDRILIHFRDDDLPKVNPEYSYGTPAGIYGYTFRPEVKRDLLLPHEDFMLGTEDLPFGADRAYVVTLFPKTESNLIFLSTFAEEDYRGAIKKLRASKRLAKEVTPANENYLAYGVKTTPDKDYVCKQIRNLYFASGAEMNKSAANFWIATYLSSRNPANWGTVIRELGYGGVIDDQGYGLIHPNEPYQGFLFPDAIATYVVADNSAPKSDLKRMETNKSFVGIDFTGKRVRHDFSGALVMAVEFVRSNLAKANFAGATIKETDFSGANCDRADFSGAVFSDAMFTKPTSMKNADLRGATGFEDVAMVDFSGSLRNPSDESIAGWIVVGGKLTRI